MTRYSADRALDAEITVDFTKGEFTSDFSLNKSCNKYNSNTGSVLHKEIKVSYARTVLLVCWHIFIMPFLLAFISLFHLIITKYSETPLLRKHHDFVFKEQKLLKWCMLQKYGSSEYIQFGKQDTNKITYTIPANLWFQYELDGEYRQKIKTLQLLRNFVKKVNGFKTEFRQAGWNVILTFTEPPQNGYMILRYLNM